MSCDCRSPRPEIVSTSRRRFIAGGAAILACAALPYAALAAADENRYTLWLRRFDTGEDIIAPFTLDGSSLYFEGYKKLCAALRDKHVASYRGFVKMPLATIEALWSVQQYLVKTKGDWRPIVVHSGYRTPETNAATEGAAWNSLHMYGKAVDFHVPGVDLGELADVCQACPSVGGVGYYPAGWVHLDTGPKRSWTG